MAVDRYLTENEKNILLELRTAKVPCNAQALEDLSKAHPAFVSWKAKWSVKYDEEALALIKNKKTIGESNQTRLRWAVEKNEELVEIGNQLDRKIAQSHEAELTQRRQAIADMQKWNYQQQLIMQNQQLINAMNRPTVMNCFYYDREFLRCSSQ